jgi:hypothetical protein
MTSCYSFETINVSFVWYYYHHTVLCELVLQFYYY